MAQNIQALIDLLGGQILKYDLSHISGEEIVNGNPEHCINLLQLVQEISVMIQNKGGVTMAPNGEAEDDDQEQEDILQSQQKSSAAKNGIGMLMQQQDQYEEDLEGNLGAGGSSQQSHYDEEEDDEAQFIQQKGGKSPSAGRAPSGPQHQARGLSSSGERRQQQQQPQFQIDDDFDNEDFSNEFGVGQQQQQQIIDGEDEDDDDLEQQFMQQLQNQPEIQKKQTDHDDEEDEEGDDQELDDDDLKMYEQFLAQNKQNQQVNHHNNMEHDSQQEPPESMMMDEDEAEEEDIDLDNIDYSQLDPQILEIAQQMGVHPKEVLKQIMKMNSDGVGDDEEDEEGGQMGDEDDGYGQEEVDNDFDEQRAREEQLRIEKEKFKQQMGLISSDKKNQQPKVSEQQKQKQQQQQVQQKLQEYQNEYEDDDDESYYSEGEIKTRIKLINQKSYSAPYIVISDCYQEPLCSDDEEEFDENRPPSKAYSTTVLQSLELQEQQQQDGAQEGTTQQLLYQQQKKLSEQKQYNQGGHNHQVDDNDDDEEELDVDISQKLLELQGSSNNNRAVSNNKGSTNKKQQQAQNVQDDGDEGNEDDDDDEEMMIDLEQLDDHNREILLEYLRQEYEKNPDQFPFPKEIVENYMLDKQQKQNARRDDQESVKDINSQEMILEDAAARDAHQIIGGGQLITDEDNGELQEDDEEDAEYLDQQQQLQEQNNNNMQVEYGGENDDEGIIDLQQQQHMQMLQQQQMMRQMQTKTRGNSKGKKNTKTSKRPKSAGVKKTHQQDYQEQINEQQQVLLPQDHQLQQLIQLLQEQQIDLENVDPNIIQQLLIAQQQQPAQVLVSHPQNPTRGTSGTRRPGTAVARKSSSKGNSKKRAPQMKTLQPYQQQQLASAKQKLPINYAAQVSERYAATGSTKKKAPTKKTKRQRIMQQEQQLLQQQYIQQQMMLQQQLLLQQQQQEQQQQDDVIQEEEEDEQVYNQQQQQDANIELDEVELANELATLQPQLNQQQLLDIPNFSEEYLNQLSEEQLEQLLIQQKQLMQMQKQQQQLQSRSSKRPGAISRPKSAKNAPASAAKSMRGPPPKSNKNPSFQVYVAGKQNQKKLAPATKPIPKKKKATNKKGLKNILNQGVLMNNFFPALEGSPGVVAMDDTGAAYPPTALAARDPRYPKFGLENLRQQQQVQQQNQNMVVQDQIDEVPLEQEEAESQENIQTAVNGGGGVQANLYQQNQEQQDSGSQNQNEIIADQDQADPQQYLQQDDETAGPVIDLTDEQLVELIQNAHNLTPEEQQQLQIILQQRMKQELVNDRSQQYQNIYDILMDNVRRAKDRLAPLGQVYQKAGIAGENTEETDRRILKQKQEFEALFRQYQNEIKAKEVRRKGEDTRVEKRAARENRIQAIRERKFQEDLLQHQKSINYKRNAQQVMLCQKVYKLASELEKNKLLQEKREYKETQQKKKMQNRLMVDAIENYYRNQISLLKERIENERFERRVASQAQQQAITRMKKELNAQKKLEVDRYLQLLRQEDNRYEFESSNVGKIEQEIIKMYKRGK